MRIAKQILIIVLLLAVFGVTLYIYLKPDGSQAADTAAAQEVTAAVARKTITRTLTASGEIKTRRTLSLKPNTDYKFKALCVGVGQTVREGYPVLEYTNGETLDAPFDLVVTNAALPAKDESMTADHSVDVSDTQNLQVQMSVYENDLANLQDGQAVDIKAGAVGDQIFQGMVSDISQIGKYDATGSKFTISVSFDNDGSLKLGMSASCSIKTAVADNVLSVPVAAIQSGEDGKYVTVKSSGGEERRKVETGISDGQDVEITNGLNEGDMVILPSAADPSGEEVPGEDMSIPEQEIPL